jgi:hypothetical protein
LGDGPIRFIIRDVKTRRIIAFLRPAEATNSSMLGVLASYPTVQFIAEEPQQLARP